MQLATESASLPFLADRPRWRMYFVPNYPAQMSTLVFSCDPAMADGVYLLHVLHTSVADEPPKEFARRHYGAFNQELDSIRSIFGGQFDNDWWMKIDVIIYYNCDVMRGR